MITLYVKSNCPFSAHVREVCDTLGVPYIEKNVATLGVAEELIKKGGKKQEPFLLDEDAGVGLYDSTQIVDYLHGRFGTT